MKIPSKGIFQEKSEISAFKEKEHRQLSFIKYKLCIKTCKKIQFMLVVGFLFKKLNIYSQWKD